MKKQILSLVSAMMTIIASAATVDIGSAADFVSILPAATAGNVYRLTADIDMSATVWTPCAFAAELDGNGCTVSGLNNSLFTTLSGNVHDLTLSDSTVNTTDNTLYLSFGCLANVLSGAVVENVTMLDCSCTVVNRNRAQYFGVLAGSTDAKGGLCSISNVVLRGCVSGNSIPGDNVISGGILARAMSDVEVYDSRLEPLLVQNNVIIGGKGTGGIVGGIYAAVTVKVKGCSVSGTTIRGTCGAGGIVGEDYFQSKDTELTIDSCSNDASVSAEGTTEAGAGGILGRAWRCGTVTINNCLNSGAIAVTASTATITGAGGILGYMLSNTSAYPVYPTLTKCVNNGTVTSASSNAGGILGSGVQLNYASIAFSEIVNHGSVSAVNYAGGLIGGFVYAGTDVIRLNSEANTGNITASGIGAGGLIGRFALPGANQTVDFRNALQTGSVTASSQSGGLVGLLEGCFGTRVAYAEMSSTIVATYTNVLRTLTLDASSTVIKGTVASGDDRIGKLVGYSFSPTPTVTLGSDYENVTLQIGGAVSAEDRSWMGVQAVLGEEITIFYARNSSATMQIRPYSFGPDQAAMMSGFSPLTDGALTDGTILGVFNTFAADNGYGLWKAGSAAPEMVFEASCGAGEHLYTVRFIDGVDSAVLKEEQVAFGGAATAPTPPQHAGWTFSKWSCDFDVIVSDLDVTAQYVAGELEHFTVRFLDVDSTVLKEESVLQGSAATPPDEEPTQPGKVFAGWDRAYDNIQSDTDITATYVDRDYNIIDKADFIAKINASADPRFVYHLTGDMDLSGWSPVDFPGSLSGDGHSITGLTGPLFGILSGTLSDVVIDGEVAGAPVQITGISSDFGVIANTNCGGTVRGVTLKNFDLTTNTSNMQKCHGFFCGVAMDGAEFAACTIETNCVFKQRACFVGGFVGRAVMSDDWLGPVGADLMAIVSCTNRGRIVCTSSGQNILGGILGAADACSAIMTPRIVLSNCVSFCDIGSSYYDASGYVGGMVGQRSFNGAHVDQGRLDIIDCANYGDIGPIGYRNTYYGGAIGYTFRLGRISISRFRNYGKIGADRRPVTGAELTSGFAGGIIGGNGAATTSAAVYGNNPIIVSDSANYGEVTGALYAGGFISTFAPGTIDNSYVLFTNCANYGVVSAVVDGGKAGQFFAYVASVVTSSAARKFGCHNCFFVDDELYNGSETEITMTGTVTPKDPGYGTPWRAAKALNTGAAAFGGDEWCVGLFLDRSRYPELKAFCASPSRMGTTIVFK